MFFLGLYLAGARKVRDLLVLQLVTGGKFANNLTFSRSNKRDFRAELVLFLETKRNLQGLNWLITRAHLQMFSYQKAAKQANSGICSVIGLKACAYTVRFAPLGQVVMHVRI